MIMKVDPRNNDQFQLTGQDWQKPMQMPEGFTIQDHTVAYTSRLVFTFDMFQIT